MAESQKVEFKFGDILIIRSGQINVSFEHPWKPWRCTTRSPRYLIWRIPGYMAAYSTLQRAELESLSKVLPPTFSGVEQSEEMLEWIWNNFSAVAGDQPSFECWRRASLSFKTFGYPVYPVYLAIFMLMPGFLVHSISATIPSARGSSRRVGLPDWRALWFRSVGWTVQEAGSIFIFCYEWSVQCESMYRICSRLPFCLSSFANWIDLDQVPGGVASPPNILAIF